MCLMDMFYDFGGLGAIRVCYSVAESGALPPGNPARSGHPALIHFLFPISYALFLISNFLFAISQGSKTLLNHTSGGMCRG